MADEQIIKSESSKEETPNPALAPRKRKRPLIGIIITILIVIATLGIWMYFPVLEEVIVGTPTFTPLPPTATATSTATSTITPTATQIPTATATLLPPSAYEVNPNNIYPPVSANTTNAILLNEDQSVSVEPAFEHPQWYSSEQISQQIGVIISEPFYATIGPGSATWKMDTPLQPGFYEIFILDTVYSSGGALDFNVFMGKTEIFPLLGIQHVEYGTLSGPLAQNDDEWRSIGLYSLDALDVLSISTAWEAREMATIVAIDRVLIIHQPDTIWNLIAQLPANSPKFVVDDSSAVVESQETWYTRSDLPAWGDQLQMVVNPEENSQITWLIPNPVPPGQYDIWVWAPPMEGNADILYKVLVNGMENQGAMVANTGNMPENQWVSLGTWLAPSPDGGYIRLGLRLDIARETLGEIAIDAVAFIFRE